MTAAAKDSTKWEGPQQRENMNAAAMDSTHWEDPQQNEDMNAPAINGSSVMPHLLCHTQ